MFDKFLIDIISLVAFKDDLLILFRSSSLMLLAVPILDAEIVDCEYLWMSPARITEVSFSCKELDRGRLQVVAIDC